MCGIKAPLEVWSFPLAAEDNSEYEQVRAEQLLLGFAGYSYGWAYTSSRVMSSDGWGPAHVISRLGSCSRDHAMQLWYGF